MSFLEWLFWAAFSWSAVFLAFLLTDVPAAVEKAAGHLRQQHTPHWARHGHVPPPDDEPPLHGRHRAGRTVRSH